MIDIRRLTLTDKAKQLVADLPWRLALITKVTECYNTVTIKVTISFVPVTDLETLRKYAEERGGNQSEKNLFLFFIPKKEHAYDQYRRNPALYKDPGHEGGAKQ